MKRILSLVFAALSWCTALYAQATPSFFVVSNSRIHYHQKGTGIPAVIFVSGMAHDHSTWKAVQDSLSNKTLTVSYDRAGLGASEYHGEKKNITSMANELDELVTNIRVPEPFILVGHSMGCQVIKKYASLHPQKIKGLVLIDPGYNEKILRSRVSDSLWQKREEMLKKYQPDFNEAQQAELNNRNSICEDADSITQLLRVPVVLFTATMVTGFPASSIEHQVKKETHLLWLRSMPAAKHILVNTSWHYIHEDAPGAVVKAIETLIAE